MNRMAGSLNLHPNTARQSDSRLPNRMVIEDQTKRDSSTHDLALLDLTGQIATLELRVVDETKNEASEARLIHAGVYLPTGPIIGSTWAEPGLFSPSGEFRGESLLLPSFKRLGKDYHFEDNPNSQPGVRQANLNVRYLMIISRTEPGLAPWISLVR
ncbi:hypothetical protein F4776DRAFT_280560 [Hypoxylon sp. NC0597]|nr:hypothetical protein F4776DRAFT_280560 [Hypoxylon sp. NC0597]